MPLDFSSRDSAAPVVFYVLLWKRNGLPLVLFYDYWRNVHGPVCARLPGQYQYWQYHVAHDEGGTFPELDGLIGGAHADDQFDGIAELTFRSAEDRQTWFTAAAVLMDDEHNIFSRAIGYVTQPGNSRTYRDAIEVGDPNGDLDAIKFHVMVRQKDGIGADDFREHMTERFATSLAGNDRVQKLRLHLFEPPDVSRPDAAGVSHSEPPEKHYQAAFEIAFRTRLDMDAFFASADYRTTSHDLARYVKELRPFPERACYTFVYGAKMTPAGQRGASTAGLITKVGATNQLKDEILDLMLGRGVR